MDWRADYRLLLATRTAPTDTPRDNMGKSFSAFSCFFHARLEKIEGEGMEEGREEREN